MYKKRLIEKSIHEALSTFPAIILTGSRQSGKTTLLKKILPKKYNYVLLDELDIRSMAINDPKAFLERYKTPLIIDEIQNAPSLLSYIKSRIDQDRRPGQWVLTGSQQFTLMKNVSESLAGRVAVLSMYSFTIEEIIGNLNIDKYDVRDFLEYLAKHNTLPGKYPDPGEWLLNGGYPELVVNPSVSKRLWFSSYIQTYIDRDVRGNIKNVNIHDFEKFLSLIASRTAQELNYSILSRDLGVSVPTIKSWISLLEASSIIYLLQPYHKNFGKRIIKAPKLYFMDTGLLSYLVKIKDKEGLLYGPMSGAIFETAVVGNFVKRFTSLIEESSLYYWRSLDGAEIDLLVETSGQIYPIEIKLASTLTSHHLKTLKRWFEISRQKDRQGFIVSTSKETGVIGDKISNIHYSLL